MRDATWTTGDQIVLRYRKGERITEADPMIVVEDSPDLIALYLAVNTPLKRRVLIDGTPWPRDLAYEKRAALPWRLGNGIMRENSVLQLTRPGAAHSTWLF